MVERPIKKSEREAAKQAEPAAETNVESAEARNVPRPVKKGDRKDDGENRSSGDRARSKGKGKGRGRGNDDAPRTPMNPALVRGPRPVAKSAAVEAAEESTAVDIEETTSTDEPTTPEVAAEAQADITETPAEAEAETPAEA